MARTVIGAFAEMVWRGVVARVRGDFVLHIQMHLPDKAAHRALSRSFMDEFSTFGTSISFGGDDAGNWNGGARVPALGQVNDIAPRLRDWAARTLPPGASFSISRYWRRAPV